MDIGKPYEVPVELCELYQTNKNKAISGLLSEIENVELHKI